MKTLKQLDKVTLTGLIVVTTFIVPLLIALTIKLTTNPVIHF